MTAAGWVCADHNPWDASIQCDRPPGHTKLPGRAGFHARGETRWSNRCHFPGDDCPPDAGCPAGPPPGHLRCWLQPGHEACLLRSAAELAERRAQFLAGRAVTFRLALEDLAGGADPAQDLPPGVLDAAKQLMGHRAPITVVRTTTSEGGRK